MKATPFVSALSVGIALALAGLSAQASSHREAPFITQQPKVDATDFYMFNSYEAGRADFVTLVANYVPLQDAYGGPNYFALDPSALYEIHVDNNGDAKEDLTFQFQFKNTLKNIALQIGPTGQTKTVSVPVINVGQIGPGAGDTGALNVIESYSVKVVNGNRRLGTPQAITNAQTGAAVFLKPVDNIGNKSIPNYSNYADAHIYSVNIPNCAYPGRVFVGQRKDPFVVNLGEAFDLINIANPVGAMDAETDSLADKNVTALSIEVHKSCLTADAQHPVVAAWTTASLRQTRILKPSPNYSQPAQEFGQWAQQSRLGAPLVNELVIGIKDKNRFNASEPKDDAQFADYVTHPTLPAIIELLFGSAGVQAPTAFPRTDLVTAFLTGINGLNKTNAVAEMLRLNTHTAPVSASMQSNLGVIGGDTAGFPNGRRPGDDVVDIALRVVMGKLLPAAQAPSGQLPFTDGAKVDASMFDSHFPYLKAPLAGSPQ